MNNKVTYKISQLPTTASELSGNELIEISAPIENNLYNSKKIPLNSIGNYFGNYLQIPELLTIDKTIVGAINSLKESGNAAARHNSIYRGKYLGQAPTQKQYNSIFDGSFDDLYIGDFWSEDPNDPSKTRWRIAGFNYYYGTGYNNFVTTNHAVIIPDIAITLNSQGAIVDGANRDALGGYKYSNARGYRSHSSSSFRTPYIPEYVAYVKATVYWDNHNKWCDTLWAVDAEHSGEDPENPGKGIVNILGGTNYVIVDSRFGIPPIFNDFPQDAGNLDITYKYHDNSYGALKIAKDIICDTFDESCIMHHEIPLTVQTFYGAKNNLFIGGNRYQQIWTDTDIEVPTAECIFGNSDMSAYNEYLRSTLAKQYYDAKINYHFDTSTFSNFDDTNPQISGTESHLEMSQLPLFAYDHSLIHTRYGYWLRNIATNMDTTFNSLPVNICTAHSYETRYLNVDPRGTLSYGTTGRGINGGIRPIFCISNTTEPNLMSII